MKPKTRTSQVSPRWALWRWFDIPDRENPNVIYLRRLRILQTPLFGIYLHWIFLPDKDRDPHDHPWNFWSFIIKGGYWEDLWNHPNLRERTPSSWRWKRFTLHRMPIQKAHKIVQIFPETITLIITGKRQRTWGFWTQEGFVPFNKYDKGSGPDPFMS